MPSVSVVIPTHNRARFITRALRSVLDQTFRAFEVLVVDDGSTDDTAGEVSRLEDPRVRLLGHPVNRGAQAARNTGIRAATGEYVAFLDSDDTWMPDKLERQITCLAAAEPEVGVVHAPCLVRVDDASLARAVEVPPLRGVIYAELLASPGPVFPTLLVRRACLDAIGPLNESLRAYHEWDTVIRLARHFAFEWVPAPLATYYLHAENAISKDWARNAEGYSQVVTAHREEIVATHGARALSRHYSVIADHYVRAGRTDLARTWHHRALAVDARNLRSVVGYILTRLGPGRYLRITGALKMLKARSARGGPRAVTRSH